MLESGRGMVMALKNSDDYVERLKKMKSNLYIGTEKIDRTDERIIGGIRIVRETYDQAQNPQFQDVCTASSHLSGETINRFCHVHQSVDDLLKKQQMTRLLCHRVGGCIQRCMGIDAINALSVITYEMDQALGTD
jgi:4-hydroxybutyryl-CoA dehydratase/vinylacetyl-CoA-Delta-isomerase